MKMWNLFSHGFVIFSTTRTEVIVSLTNEELTKFPVIKGFQQNFKDFIKQSHHFFFSR